MKSVSPRTFWQTTFAFTFIVNLAILTWSISRWVELKVILWRSVWLGALVLYLGALAGCIFLFFWIRKGNANRLLEALELGCFSAKPVFRLAAGAVFAGLLLLIPYLKFTYRVGEIVKKSTQDPVLTTILFYWAAWWLILIATAALKVAFKTSWAGGFASALVILGVAYEIFVRFHAVTTYPFSVGWSETSRYYYGSLYFAESIYGLKVPLSTLHPSRYFLQSFPFLFPGLGLAFSRFWQFFLWIGLTGVTALTLARRALTSSPLSLREEGWGEGLRWLFAGWIFLFLLRVGVYYHLEVMVFVPLLFVSAKHPWRSLAAVIFASAWAGVSRVNWFPLPAMLAVAIYLLEKPVERRTTNDKPRSVVYGLPSVILRYLATPALWAITGLLAALAAQAAYIPLSGNANNAQAFASSFSSDLLWYRLWPNDSYPLGIVPAILIVSGPLLAALILATRYAMVSRPSSNNLHPIRWVGLWGMLLVLFAGGLVVSVKIGGGGDLHNVDAYAALIGVVAAWFIGGKVIGENGQKLPAVTSWPVTAVALLIPLIFLIPALFPLQKFNQDANQDSFRLLKNMAEQAGQKGPVLFINERHLLTFHEINLPLVPEYEAVTLMEMAMSNNQPYLQQFYSDLRNHRFAAIVAGKQNMGIKEEGAFAEENNTWNTRVSPYIQCYYEPLVITTLVKNNITTNITYIEADESRIEFYVPRMTPAPAGICP
jgi:hypothetical protein